MKEPAEPHAGDGQAGEGTPQLTLAGFNGSLEALLAQARAHRIDLATLRLEEFVNQFADRLQQANGPTPLSRKADWLVMASWILLLRSNLLLPKDAPTQRAALAQAGALRDRLVALQEIQAVAAWLERRPQLGRDVFARGQPDHSRAPVMAQPRAAQPDLDVVAFLWACLDQFDDPAGAVERRPVYRPIVFALHSVANARTRILRRLAEVTDGETLDKFLPEAEAAGDGQSKSQTNLRRCSAWTSTFLASLELAKQGDVALGQQALFSPIHVSRVIAP
jgi:segregation and condensation protein A